MLNFRKFLFAINDFVNGGLIKKHYNEIAIQLQSGIERNYLSDLLKHVKANVPFYKNYKLTDINEFPVVDKSIIKSNFQDFKAQNYLNKKNNIVTTSGSTGTPFSVIQDLNKKARNYADALYFGNLAGFELGNCIVYLKIWAKQKMSKPWKYKLQNIRPIDVLHLDDKQISDLIISLENNSKKYNILGYVSALEQIIRYFDKINKPRINADIRSVITMSEGLSLETKEKLKTIFNCPVVSRYSNLENGIIAQQEVHGNGRFLVNTASYLVEIVDILTNKSASDGVLGKIIVTDLFNYAMPLIRYDTGDLGALEKEKNGKTYLTKVEGRKLDILFDVDGNIVSSYIMYKNMWQYPEILQYQLIQTGAKDYVFKINCPVGFKKEKQLVDEFKQYLGQAANFRVEYVDELPLLASGKRRKTLNLYKNTI